MCLPEKLHPVRNSRLFADKLLRALNTPRTTGNSNTVRDGLRYVISEYCLDNIGQPYQCVRRIIYCSSCYCGEVLRNVVDTYGGDPAPILLEKTELMDEDQVQVPSTSTGATGGCLLYRPTISSSSSESLPSPRCSPTRSFVASPRRSPQSSCSPGSFHGFPEEGGGDDGSMCSQCEEHSSTSSSSSVPLQRVRRSPPTGRSPKVPRSIQLKIRKIRNQVAVLSRRGRRRHGRASVRSEDVEELLVVGDSWFPPNRLVESFSEYLKNSSCYSQADRDISGPERQPTPLPSPGVSTDGPVGRRIRQLLCIFLYVSFFFNFFILYFCFNFFLTFLGFFFQGNSDICVVTIYGPIPRVNTLVLATVVNTMLNIIL